MSPALADKVIGMAWADRVSFEEIEKVSGLTESEVIVLMRRELRPGSFRRWRKRVSGRLTKHRKICEARNRAWKLTDDFD